MDKLKEQFKNISSVIDSPAVKPETIQKVAKIVPEAVETVKEISKDGINKDDIDELKDLTGKLKNIF